MPDLIFFRRYGIPAFSHEFSTPCRVNPTGYTFSGADVHSTFGMFFDAGLSDIRSIWNRLTKMPMPKPGRFWNKVTQFDNGNAPVPEMLRYRIEMPDARMPIPTEMASITIPSYGCLLHSTQLYSIL